MIEINLLPTEYQRPDKTPLPLFLTIVVGLLAVSMVLVWWARAGTELAKREARKADLADKKIDWEKQKKAVDDLKAQILERRRRQETIMDISQRKILWSQKLTQLAGIFQRYPDCWTNSIRVTTGDKGRLSMKCFYRTEEFARVSEFRDALRDSTTFFYHFGDLESESTDKEGNTLTFPIDLLLKTGSGGSSKKKKKR